MKLVTILFLRREDQILLAMKKRGFGAGKWNGVGGKVEQGETITEGAIRECQEEIGVVAHNPRLVGTIQFFELHDPSFHHNCHIFISDSWEGEPVETEEMRPEWYNTDSIPYSDMWPDDEFWLPLILEGKLFEGTVTLDGDTIVNHQITVVDTVKERHEPLTTK